MRRGCWQLEAFGGRGRSGPAWVARAWVRRRRRRNPRRLHAWGRVVACGARELAAFEQRATSGWRGVWSVMEEERPSYRRGSRATSDRRAPPKRGPPKRRRREAPPGRGSRPQSRSRASEKNLGHGYSWPNRPLCGHTINPSGSRVHGSGCFCTRSVLEKGVGLGALKLTHTRKGVINSKIQAVHGSRFRVLLHPERSGGLEGSGL